MNDMGGLVRMLDSEQFHSMYTKYSLRKIFRDYTPRCCYKHWNNWCFMGANGLYSFNKGYDENEQTKKDEEQLQREWACYE